MNDRSGRGSATSGVRLCCALAACALPSHAFAQFSGKAAATAQYESNSNVFDLNSGFGTPSIADGRRSDSFYAYGGQFEADYAWARQEFYAKASASRYNYQRFTSLDHTGYNLDAGLRWILGPRLDGRFDVLRSRNMVPFYNLSGNVLSISSLRLSILTEQRETADIGYTLNSRWRLEGSAHTSKTEQPVFNNPDLRLTASGASAALDYLGFGWITSGLTAGYLSGDYRGATSTSNPTYHETSVGLLTKYKRSRSTLDAQLGYSRRTSADNLNSTSGLTGRLEFSDQLTPRTTVTAKVDRKINNYVVNAGSEIDTDLGGSVLWQATYKSAFSAGYTFSYRDFPGQGNNPIGSRRVDIQEYVTFGINYQPFRWLLLRPYYNAQTRRSTFVGGHYSSTTYGLSVSVMTPDNKRRR